MRRCLTAAALAVSVALLPSASMADKDKGRGKHGDHYKYEYEYDDGNCKVEIKNNPGGYKEKVKCRGRDDDDYRPRYVQVPRAIPMPAPSLPSLACNRDIIGGVLGGVIGNQFGKGDGNTAMTVGGALLGVLVGGSIGRSMDQVDQACVGQALAHAPMQRPVTWSNGRADYAVTPIRELSRDGRPCREYRTVVTIDG